MILYSAADLIWATRIKAAGDALNVPCRPARTLDMLEARLADSDVRALIVDLDAPDQGLSIALIRRAVDENHRRTSENTSPQTPAPHAAAQPTSSPPQQPPIRVLAFGPHVATDLLKAAREAGAHDVLPRGAFAANLNKILLKLNNQP